MLNSQRQINIRNTPTEGPSVIKTKTEWENKYTPTYEALMGAQMADDAKAYRDRVAKTHPHTGRKMGSAKAGETIVAQVLDTLSETEWMTVGQVKDELGFGYSKTRNALDRLVTRRDVDRRIVPTADGMKKRALFRINAKAAYRRTRDEATLQFLSEPRTTSEVAEFAGLSPQRASYMLGEWFEAGEIQRDWKPDHTGRNKSLWRRKEGGK